MSILEILNEVGATSSKLAKIAILKSYTPCETLKKVFFLAYDKQTNFFTTKIPDRKLWGELVPLYDDVYTLDQALTKVHDNVAGRLVTGNAAADFLSVIFQRTEVDDCEVLARVILKDLRIGATAGTANKVWDGLIKKPAFMLAETDAKKIVYPAISQTKEDGTRAKLTYEGPYNGATLTSRNGNEIIVWGRFDDWSRKNLSEGETLDGELIAVGDDGRPLPRKISNGIVNKAVKGTISEEEAQSLSYVVWDIETMDAPYKDRLARLSDLCRDGDPIHRIYSKTVKNYDEAVEHFRYARRLGLEGTILKNMDARWQPKRSFDLVKFKAEIEIEMEVLEAIEGEGKNAGRLGAFTVATSDRKIVTNVGIFKDFPDSVRDEWFKNPPKIVTVLYNERITRRGEETESLFLPRVTQVRLDKDVADDYNRVLEIEKGVLEG